MNIEKIIDGLGAKASQHSKDAAITALRTISAANATLARQAGDANAAAEVNAMAIIGYRAQVRQAQEQAQHAAEQTGGLSEQLSESRKEVTRLSDVIDGLRAEVVALKEPAAGEETT